MEKQTDLATRTFTIGVSTIGGTDIIGINRGAVGVPGLYKYFDESDYVESLAWERSLSTHYGEGMGEAAIDNPTGRFHPRSLGRCI